MSNEGIELELLVLLQKAEQQVDKFIRDTSKKFNNLNFNPMGPSNRTGGGGGRGANSKGAKAYEKLMRQRIKANEQLIREEEKAHNKLQQQQIKANENRVREDQRAAEKLKQQRLRAYQQQTKDAEKAQQQLARLQKDALHRYELVEIQRNQVGQKATAESKRIRLQYEQQVAQIIARANSNNIAETKQALQLELAIHRKALDQKIMSQKAANAALLAGKNHQQKQASKFNNSMFQVQQAVEDASYAGFRGASNNLALMANQMGGPGGTIALIGLMGVTLAPLLAKLAGFKDKTKESAEALKLYNEQLERNQAAKIESGVRAESSIFTRTGFKDAQLDLARRERELKRKRLEAFPTFSDNPAQDALNELEYRKRLANRKANLAGGLKDPEGKTLPQLSQMQIDSWKRQRKFEEALAKDSGLNLTEERNKTSGFYAAMVRPEERGGVSSETLKGIAKEKKEKNAEILKSIRDEEKQISELKQRFAGLKQKTQDMYSFVAEDETTFNKSLSKSQTDPLDIQRDKIRQIEESFKNLQETKEKEIQSLRDEAKHAIESQSSIKDQATELTKQYDGLKKKIQEITDEVDKQHASQTVLLNQERNHLEVLEKALDLQRDLTREQEQSLKVHQKKLESLKMELQTKQSEFEFSKMSTVSSINSMKINEQGKQQMNKAQSIANKKFNPMLNYLKFMSQSPVFGQMASQKLQAVEQMKSNFLSHAQKKIQKQTESKLEGEKDSLFTKQSKFLQDKANAAKGQGEFEKQQKYLEQLQSLQMSAASSAGKPKKAEQYLAQAENTQKAIVDSLQNQVTNEQQSLNQLTKIEAQLAQIKSILQGNPNSPQAQQAQKTLTKLQQQVDTINQGKAPVVSSPSAPTVSPQVSKKISNLTETDKSKWPKRSGVTQQINKDLYDKMSKVVELEKELDLHKFKKSNPDTIKRAENDLRTAKDDIPRQGTYASRNNIPILMVGEEIEKLKKRIEGKVINSNPEYLAREKQRRAEEAASGQQMIRDKAEMFDGSKPRTSTDIDTIIDKLSKPVTQSVQQSSTNAASIAHATINSATITGVVNNLKPVMVPVGGGTNSSSTNITNRFDNLNVNVRGPAIPNVMDQLKRQTRNSSIRMG